MDPARGGGVDGSELTITPLDGRWKRLEGSHRGRPFHAVLDARAAPTGLLDALHHGGVHRQTSLEDATLALAADGCPSEEGLSCRYLSGGTHVHEYPAQRPGAPVVVLLHALAGNLHNWLPLTEHFRGRVRLVLLDLPGHGKTGARLPGPPAALGKQAVQWLDGAVAELGLDRFHLAGHSLGGRVAGWYADERRDRVQSLTLVAPALRPAMTGVRGLAARAAHLVSLLPGETGPRLVAGLVFFDMLVDRSRRNRRLVGYALQDMLHDQDGQGYRGVRAALSWLRVVPDDRHIDWASVARDMPVSLLFGAQDAYCPPSDRYRGLPGVRVRVVDGAGHLLPLEAPEDVTEELQRGLEHSRG